MQIRIRLAAAVLNTASGVLGTAALLLSPVCSIAQQTDDVSVLPFVATDAVLVRSPVTGHVTRRSGVIENLAGNIVYLRRAGGAKVERIRLRDVHELSFRKSAEYDAGLELLQKRDCEKALSSFQTAESIERRAWVSREIMASSAQALVTLGRRPEAVKRIEKILEDDPATRHVALLPVVWDERLPPSERGAAAPDELKSPSLLQRLTAASVLLQSTEHGAAARETLTELRTCGKTGIQDLAEIQLWRVRLLKPDQLRRTDVTFWQTRAAELDRTMRGAAEFLIGRALMRFYEYDTAAVSLMWMPLMCPDDRVTAAASLRDAAEAMRQSGRAAAAAQVTGELMAWFPETSSAMQVRADSGDAGPPAEGNTSSPQLDVP